MNVNVNENENEMTGYCSDLDALAIRPIHRLGESVACQNARMAVARFARLACHLRDALDGLAIEASWAAAANAKQDLSEAVDALGNCQDALYTAQETLTTTLQAWADLSGDERASVLKRESAARPMAWRTEPPALPASPREENRARLARLAGPRIPTVRETCTCSPRQVNPTCERCIARLACRGIDTTACTCDASSAVPCARCALSRRYRDLACTCETHASHAARLAGCPACNAPRPARCLMDRKGSAGFAVATGWQGMTSDRAARKGRAQRVDVGPGAGKVGKRTARG